MVSTIRLLLPAVLLQLLLTGTANADAESSPRRCQPCDLAIRQRPGGKLYAVHNPSLSSQLGPTPTPNIVWARYWDTYEDTGWDRIEISSLATVPIPDSVKARAAGYAEGQLHWSRIYDYWHNYRMNEFLTAGHQPTKDLLDWIDAQDQFVRTHIQRHASQTDQKGRSQPTSVQQAEASEGQQKGSAQGQTASGGQAAAPDGQKASAQGQGAAGGAGEAEDSEYWRLMGLVMDHFDGLCEGVWDNAAPDRNLTYHELYLLQSAGDLYDLKVLFPQHDQAADFVEEDQSSEYEETDVQGQEAAAGGKEGGLKKAAVSRLDSLGRPARLAPLVSDMQPKAAVGQLTRSAEQLEQGQGRGQAKRRRAYYPGHGAVGPGGYGNGELLECSALIKLQTLEGSEGGGSTGTSISGGGSSSRGHSAAFRGGSGGRGGSGRAAQQGRGWLAAQREAAQGDSRKLKLPSRSSSVLRARHDPVAEARDENEKEFLTLEAGEGEGGRDDSVGGGDGAGPVRPLADFWAGHATWRPYYAMLRTWKTYQFPWAKSGPITVSSSPGFVGYSKDDWYTTDDFVIMETTNAIYNKSLYELIHPNCALTWQRVQVANLGATTGAEWVSLFRRHNSGTYNNQWMVLDVRRLMKGHQSDVLWILEQIPGSTEAADVTPTLLQQGYWPSYNVPFFPRIYNASGWPTDRDLHRTAPRAQLFAREQQHVASTQDMQTVMRLNRYKTDPLSQGNPSWAIASRYDLLPNQGAVANWTQRAFGAVDAKVVDWWSFKQQITYVINGPTSDDLPPFSWSGFCGNDGGPSIGPGVDPVAAARVAAEGPDGQPAPASARWWDGWLSAGPCDSHVGLVNKFDFWWEGLQASLPWIRRRSAL